MKICKCGKQFPNTIKIDGKWRNLCNRTKCLKCLPFGTSNYCKKSPQELRTKNAEKAKRYYNNYKAKHGVDPVKTLRDSKKKTIVSLLGGECQICAYNKCMRNLVFHHLCGKDLKLSSREMQFSLNIILEEVKKCILVCHNCHGEIHDKLIDQKEVEKLNHFVKIKIETYQRT